MTTTTVSYSEELVWIESEDELELAGAVIHPVGRAPRPVAVIWVHGATSRFYGPAHVQIGRELAEIGYVFVTGNNRGHHLGANLLRRGGPQLGGDQLLGGTLWERFEDSPRDIGAGVTFTMSLGVQEVVLIGHSYGGVKVVYYHALRQDPRVVGLVLASPGPVNLLGLREPELLEEAQRLVAQGRGSELLSPQSDGQPRSSAQTFLDRTSALIDVFGAETSNPAIAQVSCPVLAFYGTREDQALTATALERIRRHVAGGRVEKRMIEGAVHSYFGTESAVATAIAEWMDAAFGDSPKATHPAKPRVESDQEPVVDPKSREAADA
jgi:pimeloyl-ACP methyl ester carboxylesterase